MLLLEDSGLEIEFVPVSQHSVHNRNTNHHYQPSPCPHTTTATNFSLTFPTLNSSTSWRAPNEKAVHWLESLLLLAQRKATYFPGRWSTFLRHYFSPFALHLNLASRLAGVWTPADCHSCLGHVSNQPGPPILLKCSDTPAYTQTHSLSLALVMAGWKRDCMHLKS